MPGTDSPISLLVKTVHTALLISLLFGSSSCRWTKVLTAVGFGYQRHMDLLILFYGLLALQFNYSEV